MSISTLPNGKHTLDYDDSEAIMVREYLVHSDVDRLQHFFGTAMPQEQKTADGYRVNLSPSIGEAAGRELIGKILIGVDI